MLSRLLWFLRNCPTDCEHLRQSTPPGGPSLCCKYCAFMAGGKLFACRKAGEYGGGGTAFVTGMSWRAMSNWTVDSDPEYYVANGTRELVLLCRKHIKGKEFVVQLTDAEPEEGEL